jgi:general secretion pathway protein E
LNEIPQKIGALLLDKGLLQEADLNRALDLQRAAGTRIGSVLVRIGAISEENLLSVLSDQLQVPLVNEADMPEAAEIYHCMSGSPIAFDWFVYNEVLIWEAEGALVCCAKDFLLSGITETLRRFYPEVAIKYLLISTYHFETLSRVIDRELRVDTLVHMDQDAKHLKELAEEAPVVELVNNIISQAVDLDASDIHIEPLENVFNVRFRIDGVLRDQVTQPIDRFAAVASRIKLISGLDIAERRLPQDGRITIRISGRDMDLRVSSVPTVFGESVVLRLLPKNRENLMLENLGLASDHLAMMKDWANSNGGIVLVTGPTGSGKSTTLHGALSATNDGVRKIITVEDPVEIQIEGISQIQAHEEIGYTFARALRAILRQDPDVIMIGEIRDLETAEIAIQSALSGHLVLSTLHTNDAISAFTRLVDMGIEPFLVAAPLKGVQAQRLVRRVCDECATPSERPKEASVQLQQVPNEIVGSTWVTAVGCQACSDTGYSGRVGIYQLVPIDNELQDMIVNGASVTRMRAYAASKGYRDLHTDGLVKASNGVTTYEEVLRVVSGDETI